jgi:hypothetical protein
MMVALRLGLVAAAGDRVVAGVGAGFRVSHESKNALTINIPAAPAAKPIHRFFELCALSAIGRVWRIASSDCSMAWALANRCVESLANALARIGSISAGNSGANERIGGGAS